MPGVREKLLAAGAKLIFECPEGKLYPYKFPNTPIDQDVFEIGAKVQLITEKPFINPIQLILGFDFGATCGAYDGVNFYIHPKMIKDIKTKTLSLIQLTYPIATLKRIVKYAKKGYKIHKIAEEFIMDMLTFVTNGGNYDAEGLRIYID